MVSGAYKTEFGEEDEITKVIKRVQVRVETSSIELLAKGKISINKCVIYICDIFVILYVDSEKIYLRTCAPSKGSGQPAYSYCAV